MAFTLFSLTTLISTSTLFNYAQGSPLPAALAPRSTPASISCKATYYSVQGDTCRSIGLGWGLYDYQIHDANTFLTCDDIWVGTPICIPDVPLPATVTYPDPPSTTGAVCQTTYYSVAGDDCASIGAKYGTSGDAILNSNTFLTCSDIWVGTPICIPFVAPTLTVSSTVSMPSPTCTETYISAQGDTCQSIGTKYGLTSSDIYYANTFLNCDDIWAYTPICIPQGIPTFPVPSCQTTYISAEGDTCTSIATKFFGVSAEAIYQSNTFLNCEDIWTYTPICIPWGIITDVFPTPTDDAVTTFDPDTNLAADPTTYDPDTNLAAEPTTITVTFDPDAELALPTESVTEN